jgi:type IV secretory pathway VirB2 component (pilin)
VRRRRGSVDFGAYLRAIPLYFRNPWLALGPLLTSLLGALLLILVPPSGPSGGGIGSGLMSIFVMLLDSFGLSISLIVAERAWRLGKGPFDDALAQARRRAPDILLAAIGYNFLIYVAGLVGGYLGSIASLVLTAVAAFFFIYTVPAAAIGGVPGGAALQASLERVRGSLASTLVLAIVLIGLILLFSDVVNLTLPLLANWPALASSNAFLEIYQAVVKAIGLGYVALVMAKAYEDAY